MSLQLSKTRSAQERFVIMLFCLIVLAGCLHSEERITVNKDGSGVVQAHLKVHPGTIQMVDMMLGGMMQAFQAMAQDPSKGPAPAPVPVSVAEQMFGNREDVEKKIRESGVPATLEAFKSEKKDDGLHVDYTIKTSDISAFTRTEALMAKLKIMRNEAGDWFCRPVADVKGQEKGQEEKAKFDNFKSSSSFQGMPAAMQNMISASMMDFRAESLVTFPDALTEVSGVFQKKDDRTASVVIGADMIMDPQSRAKWMEAKDQAIARTGSGPIPPDFFALLPEERGVAAQDVPPAAPTSLPARPVVTGEAGDPVKVFLKDGKVAEGKLLERTDGYVRIDFQGVTLTYYNDEFDRVE